jgi:hypothetical protein
MENDAIASRRGTDYSTESCPTANTVPIETIPKTELSGVVGRVIQLATPDRSSPLSDAEAKTLARIRKDRRNGFMVSAVDVDFLLEVIERFRA